MSVRVNSTQTPPATASTYTLRLGAHVAGDFLLVNLTQDGGGTEISLGNATVTISNSSPAVFTYSGADIFADGNQLVLTTSGTLPTGLSVSTVQKYFVKNLNTTANTFEVSTTLGGASVNTSSTGSGTHTAHLHSKDGWYMLGIQARAGSVSRHVLAGKFAASNAEASPVFYGSNDEWMGACHVHRYVKPTWDLSALVAGVDYARSEVSTGTSHNFPALTTPDAGRLLVYSAGFDGPGAQAHCRTTLAATRCIDKATDTNNANIYTSTGVMQQESAGAAPTVTIYKTQSGSGGNLWVLAIPNDTGGPLCPDIRPTITELYQYGNFGAAHDPAVSWQAPSSFAASINSIVTSSTGPTTGTGTTGDAKANWGSFTTLASSQNVALIESPVNSGAWVGGTHTISSTDMTGKVFGLQFYRNIPTNDNTAGTEGMLIGFHDGTNWAVFQVTSRLNGWVSSFPYTAFVAPGSSVPYASSGSINWAAVTRLGYFVHRISSSTAGSVIGVKNAVLFDTVSITGGGAARPASFVDYADAMQSWGGWNWAELNGAKQVLMKSSVQIGDGGTNTTYFDSSASSAEFPPAYGTTAVDQMKWNVTAGGVSFKIKAGPNDTINLAAGVLGTSTNQPLTVDPASSTSADYSFAGKSIVGFYPPVWKNGVPLSATTFRDCGEVDLKAVDATQLIIRDGRDTHLCKMDDGGSLTDCTLVAGGASTRGVKITAPGTYTISGCTFTGLTYDFDITATTGTVTILKDAGDPTPTYTTAGATVVISSPSATLTIPGLSIGSDIVIYEAGTMTIIESADAHGSTSYVYSYDNPHNIDIGIFKPGLIPFYIRGVALTGVSTSLPPVTQESDRNYV